MSKKPHIIIVVCEGERVEPMIFKSLEKAFFENNFKSIVIIPFSAEIYQLWNKVSEDENLDLIEIIRERSEDNREKLSSYARDDIAEIYLFFDYDGQASKACDDVISKMIAHFDDETENGKIYISYPMAEAIKHIQKNACYSCTFVNPKITGSEYKRLVSDCTHFQDLRRINQTQWNLIIKENIKKASLIIDDKYIYSENYAYFRSTFSQSSIFDNQLKKYIKSTPSMLAVLSAFPFFIVDYFGENKFNEIKNFSGNIN